ncbi:MAG: thioredoxin domain-containing protein [Candidatus Binatia bacterium]
MNGFLRNLFLYFLPAAPGRLPAGSTRHGFLPAARCLLPAGLARLGFLPAACCLLPAGWGRFVAILVLFVCVFPAGGVQSADGDKAVARVGGEPIFQSDLDKRLTISRMELERQWYQHKLKVLDEIAQDRLLSMEAKKRDVTVSELLRQEVDAKARPVSEGDVEQFLQMNKSRIRPDMANPQEQVRQALEKQSRDAQRRVLLGSLRDQYKIEFLLPEPESSFAPVGTKGAGAVGPENAPVTIVEFSDFQCPFCQKSQQILKKIRETYGDRVRLVYRDFPIPEIHPQATKAAVAARCAGEQGKFWPYHDMLFSNQQRLDQADLIRYARDLGLSAPQFEQCLSTDRFAGAVADDIAEARSLGLSSTPMFFVNGRILIGAQPFENFQKIIERELNQKKATAGR